jgi:sugar lactone lactonase YvrE
MSLHRIVVDHGSFYEGPRWHDGRWWVSDFYRRVVLSFDTDGRDVREELRVEAMPSGLGWTPDGDLLVVSMQDHRRLRGRPGGGAEVVASFGELCGGFANDMVVDAAGRAYIGNAGFDLMAGALGRTPTSSASTPMGRWRSRPPISCSRTGRSSPTMARR